jgi:cell division protein FtsI/penicillin-binding protein 2
MSIQLIDLEIYMVKQSPLLKKAKKLSIRKKFSLPRRGRIRLILSVIFITFLIGFIFKRDKNNQTGKYSGKKLVLAQERDETDSIDKESWEFKNKYPLKGLIKNLSPIIQRDRTYLTSSIDTIRYKNRSFLVYFSIDTTMQNAGRTFFKRYNPMYGAFAMINPVSGKILSLVSYSREGVADIGNDLFLRSIFPAASVFKIITVAAAVEKSNLNSSSILKTKGSNYTLYKYQLEKDLVNYRQLTLKEAFASSINPVFGRIGIFLIGADGLNEYAVKFGFNSTIPFNLENEKPVFVIPDSLFAIAEVASGFNQNTSISPLFGSMISACISNKGKMNIPTLIDSVFDLKTDEKKYWSGTSLWRKPILQSTAGELFKIMKQVALRGTARKSFNYIRKSYRFNDIDYGGKTGSVDKDGLGKIDWFVGFCRHKTDSDQHVAIGVVTVHDDNWTVHSSFLGAEMMRKYIRKVQITKKKLLEQQTDSTDVKS